MSFAILEQYAQTFPASAQLLGSLPQLYHNKLWNELTIACLQFVFAPTSKGKVTFAFYTDFVKRFQKNIDPINLLKIIRESLLSLPQAQALTFIDSFEKEVSGQDSKILLCAFRGFFLLPGDTSGALEHLNKVKGYIEGRRDVDSYIYSSYYRLAYTLYAAKRKYKQFYLSALQFIAYTQAQEIDEAQKLKLLFEMAVAVLVSDQIYNFSQLLEQPMLVSLKQSQFAWMYTLLGVFNEGNIAQFQATTLTHEELKNNLPKLQLKIRLMALMELAFNLPKNDRVVTFATLAKTCQVEQNNVEFMVMKAMALGLIRGSINQLTSQVTVTWVAPKVLEIPRVATMLKKFQEWEQGVREVEQLVQLKG